MSNTRFGHQRERDLKKQLEASGWFVIRSPASKGVADLVALKLGHQPRFIEVKGTSRSAFAGFPPADREEMLEAAVRAGASAWLVWWPKRKKASWIASSEWP